VKDEKLKRVAKRFFDARAEKTDGHTTNMVCGKEIVWIWPTVVVGWAAAPRTWIS
jgi:hypothetical protein